MWRKKGWYYSSFRQCVNVTQCINYRNPFIPLDLKAVENNWHYAKQLKNKESNNTNKSLGGWQAAFLYVSCPSMSIEKQPDKNKN